MNETEPFRFNGQQCQVCPVAKDCTVGVMSNALINEIDTEAMEEYDGFTDRIRDALDDENEFGNEKMLEVTNELQRRMLVARDRRISMTSALKKLFGAVVETTSYEDDRWGTKDRISGALEIAAEDFMLYAPYPMGVSDELLQVSLEDIKRLYNEGFCQAVELNL